MPKRNKKAAAEQESEGVIGKNLSFAASEAYKLLRTNLMFSMPGQKNCKIIGVTSSVRGEGKSTTSINTAYTLAQTGRKVLLLEADLRLPTVAQKLKIAPRPGLSNLMVGQCKGRDVLQPSGLLDNLWVITAGSTVPNPAEMLGSPQMEATIHALENSFEYIIIDLPPVTAVTDALLVSKMADGMMIVVRQNYCEKKALDETVRKLQFADAKILGFVTTGADIVKKGYRHYGAYKDYKL